MAPHLTATPSPSADEHTSLLLSPHSSHGSITSPSPPSSDRVRCADGSSPDDERGRAAAVSRRLYRSHFLSAWNARVFELGSVLYLAQIFPGSLMPMSVYALTRGLAGIVFSPAVGHYVDNGNRLKVVRTSIVLGRLTVAMSCIVFLVLSNSVFDFDQAAKYWMLTLLCVLAGVEKLAAVMNNIAVERDWVPVIAGDNTAFKMVLNAQMRRIDLFCKLLGPFSIALLDDRSTWHAIQLNLLMNTLSIPVEYMAISRVYHQIPALQRPKSPVLPHNLPNTTTTTTLASAWHKVRSDVRLYSRHRAFFPSLALALTYCTALSFSGRMVAYLLAAGLPSVAVGASRTASVAFEVAATFVAPRAVARVGSIRAGLWMSSWQLAWLVSGVAAFWALLVADMPLESAAGLVVGTVLSRVGLVGFDLCSQDVEEEHRGAFSSVEAALMNAFEMLSYLSTMVFSRPDQFRYPALFSVAAVAASWALQTVFVARRRGHLVHLPAILEKRSSWAAAGRRVGGAHVEGGRNEEETMP